MPPPPAPSPPLSPNALTAYWTTKLNNHIAFLSNKLVTLTAAGGRDAEVEALRAELDSLARRFGGPVGWVGPAGAEADAEAEAAANANANAGAGTGFQTGLSSGFTDEDEEMADGEYDEPCHLALSSGDEDEDEEMGYDEYGDEDEEMGDLVGLGISFEDVDEDEDQDEEMLDEGRDENGTVLRRFSARF